MTRLNSRLQKLEGPKKVLPRIKSVLKVIYDTGPDGPVASDDAYATIPGFDLPALEKSQRETLAQFEHRVEQISDEAFATESLDQTEAQTAIKSLKGKIEQANLHANPRTKWRNRFVSHISTFPETPRLNLSSAGFPEDWMEYSLWKT